MQLAGPSFFFGGGASVTVFILTWAGIIALIVIICMCWKTVMGKDKPAVFPIDWDNTSDQDDNETVTVI